MKTKLHVYLSPNLRNLNLQIVEGQLKTISELIQITDKIDLAHLGIFDGNIHIPKDLPESFVCLCLHPPQTSDPLFIHVNIENFCLVLQTVALSLIRHEKIRDDSAVIH